MKNDLSSWYGRSDRRQPFHAGNSEAPRGQFHCKQFVWSLLLSVTRQEVGGMCLQEIHSSASFPSTIIFRRQGIYFGNALYLGRHVNSSSISRRFVLETVLFNYPLSNHSAVEGISLLPSNSFMSIRNGAVTITKHTDIAQMFSPSPSSWKKSAGRMTDIFLDSVKKYFPDEEYFNALTGGF